MASADPSYFEMLDVTRTRSAFESSEWIRRVWPPSLRERTIAEFATQRLINRGSPGFGGPAITIGEMEEVLMGTSLRFPVLTMLLTSESAVGAARRAAARGERDPRIDEFRGLDALGDRDYSRAADFLLKAERGPRAADLRPLRVLALGLSNRLAQARLVISETTEWRSPAERERWAWLARRFAASPSR